MPHKTEREPIKTAKVNLWPGTGLGRALSSGRYFKRTQGGPLVIREDTWYSSKSCIAPHSEEYGENAKGDESENRGKGLLETRELGKAAFAETGQSVPELSLATRSSFARMCKEQRPGSVRVYVTPLAIANDFLASSLPWGRTTGNKLKLGLCLKVSLCLLPLPHLSVSFPIHVLQGPVLNKSPAQESLSQSWFPGDPSYERQWARPPG